MPRVYRTVLFLGLCLIWASTGFPAEGRKPISGPTTITAPGSYILTQSFTSTTLNAIHIDADNVTLDLNGHTITHTGSDAVIVIYNNTNIVVRNGNIVNNASGKTSIYIDNTSLSTGGEILVENIHFSGVSDAGGVFLRGADSSNCSSDEKRIKATVRNNFFQKGSPNPGHAIFIGCARGSLIENNIITYPTYRGITLLDANDTTIRENVIAWTQGSAGIRIENSRNIRIEKNVIRKCYTWGIALVNSSAVTVRYNNVSGNGAGSTQTTQYGGIASNSTSYENVIDWNVTMNNTGYGIYIQGTSSQRTVVSHNRSRGNSTANYVISPAGIDGGDNF